MYSIHGNFVVRTGQLHKSDPHLSMVRGLSKLKNHPDIGFITNLFAPFNKSHTSKFLQWEFHRATTWPLSCKSDLERNANFAGNGWIFQIIRTQSSFVVENIVQFATYLWFYGLIWGGRRLFRVIMANLAADVELHSVFNLSGGLMIRFRL